jgi:hypothetical protein
MERAIDKLEYVVQEGSGLKGKVQEEIGLIGKVQD